MTPPAQTMANELERMDDDGSPPRTGRLTTAVQVSPVAAGATPGRTVPSPAQASGSDADWYRNLGATHRYRDECARRERHAREERDSARQTACRRRWPAIIAAMRQLIRSYNEGTGAETVTLTDERTGTPSELVATVTGPGDRILVMEVDGADLWVRATQDGSGRSESERWIGLDRTDEATARYVLQNWLAQL